MKSLLVFLSIFFALFFSVSSCSQENGRLLISTMGNDVDYRVSRTVKHLSDYDHLAEKGVNTGAEMLGFLSGDSINLWVNYSHGNNSRLFGKNPKRKISYYSEGLILFDDSTSNESSRSLDDLKNEMEEGKITFTENSLIILHSCAIASLHEETGLIYGQKLADITGARVVAGQHQTEPVIEDYERLIYSNKKEFVLFIPNDTAMLMGDTLYLTNIINQHLASDGQYDFSDYDLNPLIFERDELELIALKSKNPKLLKQPEAYININTRQLPTTN